MNQERNFLLETHILNPVSQKGIGRVVCSRVKPRQRADTLVHATLTIPFLRHRVHACNIG